MDTPTDPTAIPVSKLESRRREYLEGLLRLEREATATRGAIQALDALIAEAARPATPAQ